MAWSLRCIIRRTWNRCAANGARKADNRSWFQPKKRLAAARAMVVQDVQAGPNALAVLAESLSSLSAKRLEVRLTERLLLTIGEAVEYAGAGAGYLRRQIAEGKLQLIKGAGPHGADVLRRKDLDKL